MRFLLIPFILTSFLALGSPHFRINKDACMSPATDTTKRLIIQNFGKKGNGILDASGKNGYNDPNGKNFAYVIYWSRVINETDAPIELNINFPADSFAVPGSPNAYVKLFLPPDTMTIEKESRADYGLTV